MNRIPPSVAQDTEHLGVLAMKFRSTRHDAERRDIAKEYSETVERLINSSGWQEIPAPEDQLPDDWMPKAFFDYWLRGTVP
jgi:hypothetical protein